MSTKLAKFATVVFLILNCILWTLIRGRFTPRSSGLQSPLSIQGLLGKRSELPNVTAIECSPLSYPVDKQCAHIQEACPESETVLGLEHLQAYFCAETKFRPLIFIGLLAWSAFLFSILGIGASDFFCPNLATIATVLGLDENVAGVTFLAIGNGSPDVFSTFSAMKSNAGSLAVGELLGAASFIVSVVVGSMCIIKPFHVHRGPFLRDVGFFTVAILLVLWILHDGVLQSWEAAGLVVVYVCYVTVVVVGTWWQKRQERRRLANLVIRQEYSEDSPPDYFERYHDNPPPSPDISLTIPSHSRGRALSNPNPPRVPELELPQRSRSRTPSPQRAPRSSPSLQHLPSFSLLTALEFRDVVTSLQHQSNALSLSAFEAPITPFTSRLYRTPSTRSRVNSVATVRTMEIDPFDEALGRHMRLDPLSPEASPVLGRSIASLPNSEVVASPIASSINEGLPHPPSRWQRFQNRLTPFTSVLFPHLQNFSNKSIASIFVAIFATPGVLALTITLPVVITTHEDFSRPSLGEDSAVGRLIDFEEEGVERVLVAEDELKEELNEGSYNKWLTALQCILGPLFCVSMILGVERHAMWYLIATAAAGITTAILVLIFSDRGNDPAGRLARCFMGFIVAIVWIMTIADEVVSVLKTFGLIFGLSDAIVGLTIFAIGNSLADLVANTSVARFAPIMGFSACFGGPMMNILLGIGVSGAVVIGEQGKAYNLHFSTTLLVSAVGLLSILLSTLVWIPRNKYFLSRWWGIFLIGSYMTLMSVSLVVEKIS